MEFKFLSKESSVRFVEFKFAFGGINFAFHGIKFAFCGIKFAFCEFKFIERNKFLKTLVSSIVHGNDDA